MVKKFNNKEFKFIDLFAGIGGLRIPFDELGGECVFSSEIDKYSQQTYEANFNHLPSGDITKIDEKDIPSHDLLLGGFPCQAFSNAGLRKGFEDTRGTLFFDIARILNYHKPKVFLLENVKGLLNHDNKKTYTTIIKTLKSLGYEIFAKVLNSKDFGLPQSRQRIFIVGIMGAAINSFDFPEPSYEKTCLGDILENNPDQKFTISDKIWGSHKKRKIKAREKGNGFGYSLFNKDSNYTNTISARYYKDGSEILIEQSNKNPRMLTPREASQLQGFPLDFNIPVSNGQAYKQFGNAVSVNVVRAISKHIIEQL